MEGQPEGVTVARSVLSQCGKLHLSSAVTLLLPFHYSKPQLPFSNPDAVKYREYHLQILAVYVTI